jgi:Zn-dependent M28 family amino/carboxypeptidase
MSRTKLSLAFALLVFPACAKKEAPQNPFDGKTWWDYVKILAADNMDGRETGSEGLRRAETYVVDQLKAAGLTPAGTDGFYQPVKFVSRQIVEKDCSLALIKGGKAEPLTLGVDAILSPRVDLAPQVDAPLMFVGYGLSIPEKNHDDLAGLDLKGKVAVIFTGSPADIPGSLSSHYQSAGERWKPFQRAGAIGLIFIPDPAMMDLPWSRAAVNRALPSMALSDPQFDHTAGQQLFVYMNPASAEKLFEGSGHTFQEIAELGKARKSLPRFPLPASVKAVARVSKTDLESSNIIAKLPGSDPQLKDEYVVLSAHIDHIGTGEPIDGDRINNGAMDNASGSAVLLDVAASLKKSQQKLKRSLLFVFVTAEEKGLLGSEYFTARPTVDVRSMVANINIDMFLPIVPLKTLTVYGLHESDLGELAQQVAQAEGVTVQPDPEPLRNIFIRSDQYNFILHGIPALAMGVTPTTPEHKQIFKDWFARRYHAPADDLDQPVDLSAAAQYENIIRGIMVKVADDPRRPRWKADSFFRRYAPAASE